MYKDIDVPKLREDAKRPRGKVAGFQIRRFHIPEDMPENPPRYTLLDWPRPFSKDCIIILGDTRDRAITDLQIGKPVLEYIKQNMSVACQTVYAKLEKYRWKPNTYFQAKTIDAMLLPRLVGEFVSNGTLNKPDVFLDTILIAENKNLRILKEHNIISIGGPTVNKVSDKINEELKQDGRVFCDKPNGQNYASLIYDRVRYDEDGQIPPEEARSKGLIGITRNPWNHEKVALVIFGYLSAGTIASMKRLIDANSDSFSCESRYGCTVDAKNTDVDKEIKSFYEGIYGESLRSHCELQTKQHK